MGSLSRTKGRSGEQQVARLLREGLKIDVTRNWMAQSAEGGGDLTGVDGWAIEVKRAKKYSRAWWAQAARQAVTASAKPVLIYRLDGYGRGLAEDIKWQVELLAGHCIPKLEHSGCRVTMPLQGWMDLIRGGEN